MKKEIKVYIAISLTLFVLAWWFRYDTHCAGNFGVACVSYDRFTGKWIIPLKEAKQN